MCEIKKIIFMITRFLVLIIATNAVFRYMNEKLFYILVVIALISLIWQLIDRKKKEKNIWERWLL